MTQLLVRNLPPKVVAALKARAAKNGRSTEAEHREVLERALLGPPPEVDFKTYLRSGPHSSSLVTPRSKDRGRHIDW